MRVNTERLPPAGGAGGAEALVLEVGVAKLPSGVRSEPCIAIHGSAGGVGRRRDIRLREPASLHAKFEGLNEDVDPQAPAAAEDVGNTIPCIGAWTLPTSPRTTAPG